MLRNALLILCNILYPGFCLHLFTFVSKARSSGIEELFKSLLCKTVLIMIRLAPVARCSGGVATAVASCPVNRGPGHRRSARRPTSRPTASRASISIRVRTSDVSCVAAAVVGAVVESGPLRALRRPHADVAVVSVGEKHSISENERQW